MIIYMEELSSLKIAKIRSPKKKIKNNPLFKSLKSELKEKKITIKSKRKGNKNTEGFIPTELNFKKSSLPKSLPPIKSETVKSQPEPIKSQPEPIKSQPEPVKSRPIKSRPEPIKSRPVSRKKRKITKRVRKPVNLNKYKDKTISVQIKKKKEKDINKLIKQFDNLKLSDIQSKLKSKGIDTKNKDKSKLLKYIYLLTCVDDNINLIKN
jgi:hypothetical protein